MIFAIFILASAFILVVVEWLRLKEISFFILRLVWIVVAAFILFEYSRTISQSMSEPRPLRILVDRSDSVAQVQNRKRHFEDALGVIRKRSQESKTPLEIYSFGSSLKHEDASITWGDLETRVESLDSILHEDSSASIVLMSDGQWQGHLSSQSPLTVVGPLEKRERDIWIYPQQNRVTAFLKNKVSLGIVVGQSGFSGKSVKVRAYRGKTQLEEKNVMLSSPETVVEFSFFPDRMGEELITFVVVPDESELSSLNNETWLTVRTVRDKIRILHVCGRPSLDLKAWRLFFTRQPDIDLVSFYILRSMEDDPEARDYELSLIPFPYDELFTTELDKFDIVVLQNFDFTQYFQGFYLENLRGYIERGGALLMIGGESSFQNYRDSALYEALPFSMGLERDSFEIKKDKISRVSDHPLVGRLKDLLAGLSISGRHRLGEKKDAEVLIGLESGNPFLSIQSMQRGRVAAINSDESWKLQMNTAVSSGGFFRLARKILQYLTFDPEVERGAWKSTPWKMGEAIRLESEREQKISWRVESLSVLAPWSLEFENLEKIEFEIPRPGAYRVTNKETALSRDYQSDEKPWLNEWLHVLTNQKALEELAVQSRGHVVGGDEISKISLETLSGRQILSEKKLLWLDENPFVSWAVGLLFLLCLCADWWLRFRKQWD